MRGFNLNRISCSGNDFHFFILYFYIYSIVADKMLIEFSKKLLNYIIRTLVRVC